MFTTHEFSCCRGCKLPHHTHSPLELRHSERDSFSDHQPHDCLLNRLFRRRSKKTSKLRVTGLCAGNSPGTGEFPAQKAVTRKMFPFDDVSMSVRNLVMPPCWWYKDAIYFQTHFTADWPEWTQHSLMYNLTNVRLRSSSRLVNTHQLPRLAFKINRPEYNLLFIMAVQTHHIRAWV